MKRMRINNIKARMNNAERVYGCLFSFPSLQIVEMVGILGFDYIFIDGEHGAFTMTDIEQMCIVADGMDLTPLARVPDIHPSTILRFLDRGIMGIIGPHISTKADVETFVKACKFPPQGIRSFAGNRIYNYEIPWKDATSYIRQANDEVLIIAMLEDIQALENLPEMLTVDELNVIGFGPFDLSLSLGFSGRLEHPKMVKAMEKGAAQIRSSGKIYHPDLMLTVTVSELLMSGGREFLHRARNREKRKL